MKAKDFKPNEKTIELLDGSHKIAIDFNAFEQLEGIYGSMQTAFSKFSGVEMNEDGTEGKGKDVKFVDIKNFLCAGINAAIENEEDMVTPYYVGKILDISKLESYVNVLMELLTNAMPKDKEVDEDADLEKN